MRKSGLGLGPMDVPTSQILAHPPGNSKVVLSEPRSLGEFVEAPAAEFFSRTILETLEL